MTASFSLPADPVPDLQPDEKPLHTVASMGYFHGSDSGSIYTNTTLTVAGSSTCAVAQDGSLRCWGSNTWGQTGLWPFENNPTLSPSWLVQHHSPSSTWNQTWTEVEGDNQHYCGITDNKDMYCWVSEIFERWGVKMDYVIGCAYHNKDLSDGECGAVKHEVDTVNLEYDKHTEGRDTRIESVVAALQHLCAEFTNTQKTMAQKKGQGIYRRVFHHVPLNTINRRLPQIKELSGSKKYHQFLDVGIECL